MGNIFFERFSALCKSIDETPNSIAKVLGIASGSITAWKNGAEPRNKTLAKIADYFQVSTDYLLGKEEMKKAPAENGKRSVSDDDIKFALFRGREDITDAMYQEVLGFAEYVARREEEKKKKE